MHLCDCCRARSTPTPGPTRLTPREAVAQTGPLEQVDLSSTAPRNPQALAATGEATAYQALVGPFHNFSVASLPRLHELAERHDPARITHVLYHKDCLDGMTAAWAAWKKLGDQAEYIPVTYQTPVPELPPGARVAVVDFSFLPEQMRELKSKVADVVVLDHHDTAQERLSGPEFQDYVLVDQQRAGAGLTWHYFHPDEPLPPLVAYAEDRDLWRFDLPLSAEVNKAMASHPFELATWDGLDVNELKAQGVEIYAFLNQQNQRLADLAQVAEVDGHQVPVVNSPTNVDELAAVVLERFPKAPFMACYFDDADGNRRWEVRSRSGFVVNQVAARFGGGGHKEAAGFTEMLNEPIAAGPGSPAARAEDLPQETEAVRRFATEQVHMAMSTARMGTWEGASFPVCNSALNVEDVGRALQARFPEAERVGVYHDGADGRRYWALFGPGGREDFREEVERAIVARPVLG